MLFRSLKDLIGRFSKSEMDKQLKICDCLFRDVANFTVFNQVRGDYYEFGVYKGHALIRMHYWLQAQWRDYQKLTRDLFIHTDPDFIEEKRFFAFDSFKGLPHTFNANTPSHFVEGAYKASLHEFNTTIKRAKIREDRVIPIQGWFQDTLTDTTRSHYKMQKASIVFIDCDLESSAQAVMDFLSGIIQDGTVIIIDDFFRYKGHPERGVQGKFNDWRKQHPDIHVNEIAKCSANRVAFCCNFI